MYLNKILKSSMKLILFLKPTNTYLPRFSIFFQITKNKNYDLFQVYKKKKINEHTNILKSMNNNFLLKIILY